MAAALRVAIVSPHRDDAAFSCGLAILALLRTGAAVTLHNIFTVSDYTVTPERFASAVSLVEAVSAERLREDKCFVAAVLSAGAAVGRSTGSLRLHDFAWQDAPLRLGLPLGSILQTPPSPTETARLAEDLKALEAADLVFAPLGLGNHIDHLIARDAAVHAAGNARLVLYEDLPYAARMSPVERDQAAASASSILGCTTAPPAAIRLPGGAHQKMEFAMLYPSQIDAGVAAEIAADAAAHGDAERVYTAAAETLRGALPRQALLTEVTAP